jgi:protein gp37
MTTKIEWAQNADGTAGETWNPLRAKLKGAAAGEYGDGSIGWHCELASPGCGNCYAQAINVNRFGTGLPYTRSSRDKVEVFVHEPTLSKPTRWQKPRTVFPCSMTDLFAEFYSDDMIDQVQAVMGFARRHRFIVLTKRADRLPVYYAGRPWGEIIADMRADVGNRPAFEKRTWRDNFVAGYAWDDHSVATHGREPREPQAWPLPNVALNVSVENQEWADKRIPHLLNTPAAIRGLSIEPMLGPVDVTPYIGGRTYHCKCGAHDTESELIFAGGDLYSCATCGERCKILPAIDWVIIGVESDGSRVGRLGEFSSEAEWIAAALRIVAQCLHAGVAVFVKQVPINGRVSHDPNEWPEGLRVRQPIDWTKAGAA